MAPRIGLLLLPAKPDKRRKRLGALLTGSSPFPPGGRENCGCGYLLLEITQGDLHARAQGGANCAPSRCQPSRSAIMYEEIFTVWHTCDAAIHRGRSTKLDESCLVEVQSQSEFRESFRALDLPTCSGTATASAGCHQSSRESRASVHRCISDWSRV